jgi:type IV secretory pathway VirD2 relaxase
MSTRDSDLHVRPGRIGNRKIPGAKSFVGHVLRATQKAGGQGRGGLSRLGQSNFGRGRTAFARNRLFGSHRRVMVKARPVIQQGRGARSAPLSAHLAYLRREGVTRDGTPARMFEADTNHADDAAFAERCKDDRHHFRFIVSPEDAAEITDLKAFIRDLAAQMEVDLGTKLDWVAVDHWNTDNPHVHLLVRGVAEDGSDLVIAREYISRNMRSRAEELVGIELGPKPEHEIRSALEREVGAERWTRLDAEIRVEADAAGFIDLRAADPNAGDPEIRRLMIARLQRLEQMGLAAPAGPAQWVVALDAEQSLRDLGMRGDIIRTMQRALTEQGQERALTDYVIESGELSAPIAGRLIEKGLHNELTGEAYAIIDGTDGRAHHVRLRGIEVFEHSPPVGGIIEVRRFGGVDDPRPTLVLANRSDIDLPAQVTAPGATWLDHRLVARAPEPVAMGGFGAEARVAMEARTQHLLAEGLARQHGDRIVFARNLLDTLRRRDIEAAGRRLATETGLPHVQAATGEHVAGTYRQRVNLTSGRFAVIDDGLGFSLVPWSPSLEQQLGRRVAGVTRSDGGIEWGLGRRRGLGL